MNIRLRNHGPLGFLYGKFCVRSCISIISSDFFWCFGYAGFEFFEVHSAGITLYMASGR